MKKFSWALYDFANSAYATSVLSVIFNVYFVKVLIGDTGLEMGGFAISAPSVWSYLISAVMAAVLVLSPALGALSDAKGLKRAFLTFWATLGSIATIAMGFLTPGHPWRAIVIAFVGTLAFEMSLVFYNAFLNEISDAKTTGRVSGFGFALGYIGGGLCLALNIWMLKDPSYFGLSNEDGTLPVRACMWVAGAWWFLFSLPSFIVLKDRVETPVKPFRFSGVFRQLKETWSTISQHPSMKRFLLSYLVFEDGIITVLLMASIFGAQVLGMSSAELALCLLMVQFVAFIGAIICGRWADSWSHKGVLMLSLIVFAVVTLWAVFITSPKEFWIMAFIAALVLGGSQAAARSLFSLMVPANRSGELYSFFSIVGKAASMLGPFVFGVVNQWYGLRPAVASLLIFFIIGGALLVRVKEVDCQSL